MNSAVLNVLANPIYVFVRPDNGMVRVNHNHFKPLVKSVFPNPVGIEHLKVRKLACSSLLSNQLYTLGGFEFLDTHAFLPTASLGSLLSSSASSHSSPSYNEALLRLVSQLARSIQTQRPLNPNHGWLPPPFYQTLLH